MRWSAFDLFVFPFTSNSLEVFVKVNSSQFSSHFLSGKFIENFIDPSACKVSLSSTIIFFQFPVLTNMKQIEVLFAFRMVSLTCITCVVNHARKSE